MAYVVDRPTLVCRNASQEDGATGRREPAVMASLPSGPGAVHVGMDTSMREIVYGVLRPGMEVPAVDRIPNDGESVRRLSGKLRADYASPGP